MRRWIIAIAIPAMLTVGLIVLHTGHTDTGQSGTNPQEKPGYTPGTVIETAPEASDALEKLDTTVEDPEDDKLREAVPPDLDPSGQSLLSRFPKAKELSGAWQQPFPPSYLSTDLGRELNPSDWEDPKVCMGCHPRQFKGWQGSMHSNAFKDPIFQAEWALAHKELGDQIDNLCGACHSPVGVLTQTITFDPERGINGGFTAPPIAEQGVFCDVCHTVSGTTSTHTNTLEPGNASLVASPGKIKRGPLKDAKSPYHETAYSELHTKAEFCGNCHNVFNPVNDFPIERTYDEWKYSIYAQHGIQCQDCHMVPLETAWQVADTLTPARRLENHALGGFAGAGAPSERDLVHDHAFVGGNALITASMGDDASKAHAEIAIGRLQNVARLDLEFERVKGPLHELRVKVTNERAGHDLPTSLTYIRQVWLDVTVTDDQGNELLRSGTIDEHNEVDPEAVMFKSDAVDMDGNPTEFIWRIARFEDRNTIPPRGHKYGKYYFNVPEGADEVHIVGKLQYRSFSQHLADHLLGQGELEVPTIEMEKIEQIFKIDDV